MNTTGIFYIPTRSFDETTNAPSDSQFEGILQKPFTFDQANSIDDTTSNCTYLEIPLNQLRGTSAANLDKRYNSIIVEGTLGGELNKSINYFRHIWTTDWNISDSFPSNIRFDSFENSAADSTDNTYNPPATAFVNAFGTECCSEANDIWFNLNDEVVGWSKKNGGTGSGGTGPAGGCDANGNPVNSPASDLHYIYAETSSPFNDGDHVFIARTRANNFTDLMSDTSNNLNLVYNAHMFGQNMGTLRVYVDTNSQSSSINATLLDTIVGQQQTSTSQPYLTRTLNLNAYKEVDDNHYFYFVYQHYNNSGIYNFRADCALDNIKIVETIDGLNEGSEFTYTQLGDDSGGESLGATIVGTATLVLDETTETPTIKFRITTGKDTTVKGSYLLI